MASTWPAAFDFSFPGFPYQDNTEFVLAVYANSWISAIQALETGIGFGSGSSTSNPLYSATYNETFSTITARIANVEADAASSVSINSAVNNILPVAGAASVGNSGLAADAKHQHLGVSSINGRTGAVTLQGGDFGTGFTAAGGLIAGTGNGTSEILPIGAAGSHLVVGGGDPSGLFWQAAEWQSGDYKFSASVNLGTLWLVADGSNVSRASQSALFNAITLVFTGTAAGNTISGITGSAIALISMPGYVIEGPGLGASSTVTGVGASSITVSNAPTGGAGTFRVFLAAGNGDGSTTFTLPDMRGRVPVGAFGPGTNAQPNIGMGFGSYAGGQGEAQHSLSVNEGPQHLHLIAAPGGGFLAVIGNEGFTGTWVAPPNGSQFGPTALGLNVDALLQTVTSGAGALHNNMQPFLGGRWFIHV